MRNQIKPERASQPTTQPSITTKCATCAHRFTDHNCNQHDQRATHSGGYRIVLECSGHTLSSEAEAV